MTWDLDTAPSEAAVPRPPERLAGLAVPNVVVLITSVTHRRAELYQVLDALAAQTFLPTRVVLVLDGGPELDAERVPPAIRAILRWEATAEPQGAGLRWQALSPESARGIVDRDAIVVTLDDDILPDPDFLERTVALVITRGAVVTWHGWRHGPDEGGMHTAPARDVDAVAFGAGCAAYRWGWLRHLRAHPFALELLDLGPRCDDDALLALELWERGTRVLRPAGPPPLRELPASRASSASFLTHGDFRSGQRLALATLYDAPICPLGLPREAQLDGYFSVVEALYADIAARLETRTRAALHRIHDGREDPIWHQLRDALYALRPGDRVLETEPGPWSRWLELYCASRRILLWTVCTTPPLYNALCVRRRYFTCWSDEYGVLTSCPLMPAPPAPERRFTLEIVAPYRDASNMATNTVKLV